MGGCGYGVEPRVKPFQIGLHLAAVYGLRHLKASVPGRFARRLPPGLAQGGYVIVEGVYLRRASQITLLEQLDGRILKLFLPFQGGLDLGVRKSGRAEERGQGAAHPVYPRLHLPCGEGGGVGIIMKFPRHAAHFHHRENHKKHVTGGQDAHHHRRPTHVLEGKKVLRHRIRVRLQSVEDMKAHRGASFSGTEAGPKAAQLGRCPSANRSVRGVPPRADIVLSGR